MGFLDIYLVEALMGVDTRRIYVITSAVGGALADPPPTS